MKIKNNFNLFIIFLVGLVLSVNIVNAAIEVESERTTSRPVIDG